MIRVFPDKTEIMTDQKNGHMIGGFQTDQCIQEHSEPVPVDPADGFIQNQKIWRGIQGQSQQNALQLASGASAKRCLFQTRRIHSGQSFTDFPLYFRRCTRPDRPPGKGGSEKILHRQRHFRIE